MESSNNKPQELSKISQEVIMKVIADLDPKSKKQFVNAAFGQIQNKSNEVYFTKDSALSIQPLIDEMIVDRCNRHIPWADYYWIRPNTLRQKMYSGINYLMQNMDPDGKYKKWYAEVQINMNRREERIEINFIKAMDIVVFKGVKVEHSEYQMPANSAQQAANLESKAPSDFEHSTTTVNNSEWKSTLAEIMGELPTGKSATISGLSLRSEDKDYIEQLFADLDDFRVMVTNTSIKIIHSDDPNLPKFHRI